MSSSLQSDEMLSFTSRLNRIGSCVSACLSATMDATSLNGRSPHNISYNMTPTDHKSALAPYGSPLMTSGAMYKGEPHMVAANASESITLANPKSAILSCL